MYCILIYILVEHVNLLNESSSVVGGLLQK